MHRPATRFVVSILAPLLVVGVTPVLRATASEPQLPGVPGVSEPLLPEGDAVVVSAVDPGRSTATASPPGVPADGTSSSTVTVTAKNATGGAVTGVTVTLVKSAGGGSPTITPASATSGKDGSASFTVKSTTPARNSFQATADGVVITQVANVDFTGPVSATESTVTAAPASVPADGNAGSTVTVTLKDANSAPVAGKIVRMAKSAGPGTPSISPFQATTNSSGVAAFTVTSTTVGTVTFQATDHSDSIVIAQTADVIFASLVSAANSTVVASPTSLLADGVAGSTVTVTVKNAGGALLSGRPVTLAKASGPGSPSISPSSVNSSSRGEAAFTVKSTTSGSVSFEATAEGVVITQRAQVSFNPGPVSASTSTLAASPTTVTADGTATSNLTVTLKDANGNGVGAKTVTVAKSAGPGSPVIAPASAITDSSGVARFTATSTTAATNTFRATDTTDSVVVTQTANVTFAAGPVSASVSSVSASPATVAADGITTSTVTVALKDAHGNPVAGKTASLAKVAGPGSPTIGAASGASNASGVVTFAVKSTTPGVVTFEATDTTDSVVITDTADVTFAGPVSASVSTVTASPASVVADGSATSAITVTLKDADGNPVAGKSVSLAKISGPGTPTISASSGPSNDSGVVTFTVKSTTAGTNTFRATDTTDSLVITQSADVTFVAGPASAAVSTVAASPSSVPADGVATSTVTVTLKDSSDNPVAGKTVTLAKASGPGTVSISSASEPSDASGVVTFTAKTTVAGTYSFRATDITDSVVINQTASVSFTPGAVDADMSIVVASPQAVPADDRTASTITVTLRDVFGNAVPGKSVSVAEVEEGFTRPRISAPSGPSNSSGVVTFSVTSAFPGKESFEATEVSQGLVITQTADVTFTPTSDQLSSVRPLELDQYTDASNNPLRTDTCGVGLTTQEATRVLDATRRTPSVDTFLFDGRRIICYAELDKSSHALFVAALEEAQRRRVEANSRTQPLKINKRYGEYTVRFDEVPVVSDPFAASVGVSVLQEDHYQELHICLVQGTFCNYFTIPAGNTYYHISTTIRNPWGIVPNYIEAQRDCHANDAETVTWLPKAADEAPSSPTITSLSPASETNVIGAATTFDVSVTDQNGKPWSGTLPWTTTVASANQASGSVIISNGHGTFGYTGTVVGEDVVTVGAVEATSEESAGPLSVSAAVWPAVTGEAVRSWVDKEVLGCEDGLSLCKVLQFNASGGAGQYKGDPIVAEDIGRSIVDFRPIVVTLNETCAEQRSALMDYLASNGYPMEMRAGISIRGSVIVEPPCTDYGNAILVAGSITNTVDSELEPTEESEEVRHLTCVDAQVEGTRLWACVTHLVPGNDGEFRNSYLEGLRTRHIGEVAFKSESLYGSGRPIILGGDFNATPLDPTPEAENLDYPHMLDPLYNSAEGGFGHFKEAGGMRSSCDPEPSPCATHHSDSPTRKIDYLFFDTDHWPLLFSHTSPPKQDEPHSDHLLLKAYTDYDA